MIRSVATGFTLWCCATVQAAVPPDRAMRVLRSDHFELVFHDQQRVLADIYIDAAERAYELLVPLFGEAPAKTIIFLSDDQDSSNGMATFLPYPRIVIFPVLPSTNDSIAEYGDWPLEIMVHEYTHILNMHPAHGLYVPLKWIFGGVIRPNALLPRWYLEGLAVNNESRLTDHGRLRADRTQAMARALALSHRLDRESIAHINEQDIGTWPYGARPYLYGGWWWNQVQGEHGTDTMATWNRNFSRRLPFLLNGPLREVSGKTAQQILSATTSALNVVVTRQLNALKAGKPHSAMPIANEKGEQSVFAVSPSGAKLVYWVSRPTTGTEVKIKVRNSPTQAFSEIEGRRLFKSAGTLRVRWINEDLFVFDQMNLKKPRVSYRDLYLFDFKQGQVLQVTDGWRAQEPTPAPKSDRLAFIQNDGGRNRLAMTSMYSASKSREILVEGNFGQRLSGPEFLNENEILYVRRDRNGVEQLYTFNLLDKKTRLWHHNLLAAQNPRLTAKGILVSDGKSHVRNIYLAASGKGAGSRATAVTNSLTYVDHADYDPGRDELVFSELTADGRKLHAMPLATFQPANLEVANLPPPPRLEPRAVVTREESYQPLAYLWPRYWVPFVYTVENGGLLLQGSTSNHDPAGRNRYSAAGSYDTNSQKPSYAVAYVNSSLPTDIGVSYSKATTYFSASKHTLESQVAALALTNYWPFNDRDIRWSLGGEWSETKSFSLYRRIGPQVAWRYSRLQHPLNTWFGFSNELNHTQYMPQKNYLAYGRSFAHLAQTIQLGGGHKISLHERGAVAPDLPFGFIRDLGDRSVGANYLFNLANSDFLLRGYPSGTFIGRKIVNANAEYALPLFDVTRGLGTFPLFFRALEVALFADALAVDGAGFRPAQNGYFRTTLNNYFMSTGAELRLSTTAAYHLPVNFTLGAYYGLNQQYGGGFTPFLGLGLGDLGALENKTP